VDIKPQYKGIFFMLLAAAGFSIMAAAAKMLRLDFNAGQLVFWRNMIGALVLVPGLIWHPVEHKKGGKTGWLVFRGFMGAFSLYALLYCVINMPLGTAMTYNLTSTIWIAIFSFFIFKEFAGYPVILCIAIGFIGMLLVYQPNMHLPWYYHFAGFISGISSAIAYITVGRLNQYYDARLIVLSFILGGIVTPLLSMAIQAISGMPDNGIWLISWKWPVGQQWIWVILMGTSALFGQYFVTRAYGSDKASVVSAISYANIVFSIFLGVLLGDAFPDIITTAGILLIILSGILISVYRKNPG
jgi:drug/metabolite transporter (DMT)-like permease